MESQASVVGGGRWWNVEGQNITPPSPPTILHTNMFQQTQKTSDWLFVVSLGVLLTVRGVWCAPSTYTDTNI